LHRDAATAIGAALLWGLKWCTSDKTTGLTGLLKGPHPKKYVRRIQKYLELDVAINAGLEWLYVRISAEVNFTATKRP
jgi:hypothetical protein